MALSSEPRDARPGRGAGLEKLFRAAAAAPAPGEGGRRAEALEVVMAVGSAPVDAPREAQAAAARGAGSARSEGEERGGR